MTEQYEETPSTVEIYDGDKLVTTTVLKGKEWNVTLPITTLGTHSITARLGNLRSSAWAVEKIDPLQVLPSRMVLDGYVALANWTLSGNDVPGNTEVRTPSGGLPPYTYSSSNQGVASVTSAGKVKGLSNGTATITINDITGKQVSYPVTVSNVCRVVIDNNITDPTAAMNWIRQQGGSTAETMKYYMTNMTNMYAGAIPPTTWQGFIYQVPPDRWAIWWYQYQLIATTPGASPSQFKGAIAFVPT